MDSLLQHGTKKPGKVTVEAWPPPRPSSAPHCALLTPTQEIQSTDKTNPILMTRPSEKWVE